jgi:hypothetical protein
VRDFRRRVVAAVRADRPECGIARTDGPDDIREAHFQLSRPMLSFASLSRLAGHVEGDTGRFDGPPPPFDEAAVRAALVQRHVRAVRDGEAAFIGELYRARQRETHRVAWPCPPAYLDVSPRLPPHHGSLAFTCAHYSLPFELLCGRACDSSDAACAAVPGRHGPGCCHRLQRQPAHMASPPRLRFPRLPALPGAARRRRHQHRRAPGVGRGVGAPGGPLARVGTSPLRAGPGGGNGGCH